MRNIFQHLFILASFCILPTLTLAQSSTSSSSSTSSKSVKASIPDPYSFTVSGTNYTLSNYSGPLGNIAGFAQGLFQCHQVLFSTPYFSNASISKPIQGTDGTKGKYQCPGNAIVLNATNALKAFQPKYDPIVWALGTRALSMDATATLAKGTDGFAFDLYDAFTFMESLYLGVLNFGEDGVPAFDIVASKPRLYEKGPGPAVINGRWG